MKRQVVAVLLGYLLLLMPSLSLAGTFRDNFDDGDFIGWKPNIAAGISVVDGELSLKGADSLFVKVGDPLWKGYSFETQVKIAEFTNGGWFSIRTLQGSTGDLTGYYELRFTQSGTIAMLHVNNQHVESFRVPEVLEENVWHSVKIESSNGKVLFYLDGVLTAQLTDLKLSGYVDICSTKGTHVYIDSVVIPGPNVPDTGPSGPNSFAVYPRSKSISTWGKTKQD